MLIPPEIDGAIGLAWRRRRDGLVAVWLARPAIIRKGYRPKTVRLWPAIGRKPGVPTDADCAVILAGCKRQQEEMLRWARQSGDVAAPTPGALGPTIADLSRAFQTDPDSSFQALRYDVARNYVSHIRAIELTVGARRRDALTGRDFKHWHEQWSIDPDGSLHLPRAYYRMSMVRNMVHFGASILADPTCIRLTAILDPMRFKGKNRRKVALRREHVIAIRAKAHEMGWPEIALAEALRWDLMLRPKDVYGEWIPRSWPGLSDVLDGPRKWIIGLHWRECSPAMVLTHRLSKSLKGRRAILDPAAGETKTWNLQNYPMVMEEIALIAPEQRVGPMVKSHNTGLPFAAATLRQRWREVATAAGVPKHVQGRDSRPGSITHGLRATGGDLTAVQHAAGHAQPQTTAIYNREADEQTDDVALRRTQFEQAKNVRLNGNK